MKYLRIESEKKNCGEEYLQEIREKNEMERGKWSNDY